MIYSVNNRGPHGRLACMLVIVQPSVNKDYFLLLLFLLLLLLLLFNLGYN